MFGKDKIKNAVHCTDLPDDGVLEVSVCVQLSVHVFVYEDAFLLG